MNNKIAAFTLVEVIIVVILSLLVLGVVLLGFRHFQQYRAIQESESQRVEEILLIQSAMNTWFFKAHEILLVDDALLFKDSVIFGTCRFEEDFLILSYKSNVDRFRVRPHNIKIKKYGKLPYVYELSFEIASMGEFDSFLFKKDYEKSVLFNSKEIDYEY